MGSQLQPNIRCSGHARQAMAFHQEDFGGEPEMGTVPDLGKPDSPNADRITPARLATPVRCTPTAWDVPVGVSCDPGNIVAACLSGGGEPRGYVEKSAAGGAVTLLPGKRAWGDEAGMLGDPFGITGMFIITSQPTRPTTE